jgi:hypothetical protein
MNGTRARSVRSSGSDFLDTTNVMTTRPQALVSLPSDDGKVSLTRAGRRFQATDRGFTKLRRIVQVSPKANA